MSKKINAIADRLLVINLEMGTRTTSTGIIIPDDNMKTHGIRPRWCQVHSIGPRCLLKNDLEVNDWILVSHGRWSTGVKYNNEYIWQVDPKDVLLTSKTKFH